MSAETPIVSAMPPLSSSVVAPTAQAPARTHTWLWRVYAALSVAVGGYALIIAIWLGAAFHFPTNVVDDAIRDRNAAAGALHFVFNGLALALGPFQFRTAPTPNRGPGAGAAVAAVDAAAKPSPKGADSQPQSQPQQQLLVPSGTGSGAMRPPWYTQWHRMAGWGYVVCTGLGTASSLKLSLSAQGGAVSTWGFAILAVYTLLSTTLAVVWILRRRISLHRAWMTRSFAGLFSAVTLRIYLPALIAAHAGQFEPAYRIVAWLCWVPNVIVAEWLVYTQTQSAKL